MFTNIWASCGPGTLTIKWATAACQGLPFTDIPLLVDVSRWRLRFHKPQGSLWTRFMGGLWRPCTILRTQSLGLCSLDENSILWLQCRIFSPEDIYLYIFICLFIYSQINIFRILTAQIGIINTVDSTQSKPQAKENRYHEQFCDPVFPLCETHKRMYQDITHDHLHTCHFRSSYRFDLSIVPWLEKEHILIKPMQAMSARSFSRVRLFAIPWTVDAHRLLRPWDSPGKSTGVGCHALLQGFFLTQR